jgi:hypothetical protein
MKSFLVFLLAVASFTAPYTPVAAQKPSVGCIDKSIRLQADEIKHFYTEQGMVVLRDAMINMESMVPFPVMAEFRKGERYQIVFVGHQAVQRMKMEVFDGNDNRIEERFTYRSRQQPNYIIYNFAPERTDTYLFTFMQKLKNENMCGSLCILKLDANKQLTEIKPYQP